MTARFANRCAALFAAFSCGVVGLPLQAATAGAAVPPARAASGAPGLFIAQNGVALSQFPSSSRLTANVLVGVTQAGTTAHWKARSDSSWLTVTESGRTGQSLTLTANPAGLDQDQAYTATVTVSTTSSSGFQDTETIRVGFWVGSADPSTVTISHLATSMAANPVAPVVYVADGSQVVDVFNVYSGQKVGSFPKVAPSVGEMVASSDGTTLFVVDTTNYRILELDAKSGKSLASFRLKGPIYSDFSFALARPAGQETLFAPGQSAIDVATGAVVSSPITNGYAWYDPLITASADGTRLAVVERGLSPGSLYGYTVTSSAGALTIKAAASNTFINGENCQAMAMSLDGARVYPACGAPYEFDVFNWSTMQQVQTLPAAPYPNNAVIDSNGDFVGGLDGIYDADDVYIFDPKGYRLGVVPTTPQSYDNGQQSNVMATSGDSTRVVSATAAVYNSQQTLMLRTLP